MTVQLLFAFATLPLVAGGVSYGLFGIYAALFLLAIWSSAEGQVDRTDSRGVAQRRLRYILWVTAFLMTARQVTMALFIRFWVCWSQENFGAEQQWSSTCGYRVLHPLLVYIPQITNIVTPPLIALLSDGILAWRVFVVWSRPPWLRYLLALALGINFVVGETAAIMLTTTLSVQESVLDQYTPGLYKAWGWMAFMFNSAMSIAILARFRSLGDIRSQGLGRYLTVISAVIESALLSWIALLGSVISWNSPSRCGFYPDVKQRDCFWVSILQTETDKTQGGYSVAMFFALPVLLAISQVLIVTRANFSKIKATSGWSKSIMVASHHWDSGGQDVPVPVSL